jgi:hypothetical protein
MKTDRELISLAKHIPTPEHEEMAREGILPQHALHQHGEPIDALARVDIAEGQVHLVVMCAPRWAGSHPQSLPPRTEQDTLCYSIAAGHLCKARIPQYRLLK